jgi:hypothetical protein
MKDIMIDIETLGTGTRGLITQIGACYFDRNTGEIGDKFCENIQIQDALDNGFEVRGDTIKFWLEQDKEVIQKMIKNALPVTNAGIKYVVEEKELSEETGTYIKKYKRGLE